MAGRKSFLYFQRVIQASLAKTSFSSKPVQFNACGKKCLRGIARSLRNTRQLPEVEDYGAAFSGNDSPKISASNAKPKKQFVPFKVEAPEVVTAESQHECLAQVVTPLWNMPYNEQLQLKQRWAVYVLTVLRKRMEREGIKNPINIQRALYDIVGSPVTEKYRNKDELSINAGIDGNPKTVGFYIGAKSKGNVVCVSGEELVNMRDSHKRLAQEYIMTSPLRACHHFEDGGHWRNLIIRSNLHGDLMAIVVFHPQSMNTDELDQEAMSVAKFFSEGNGKECNISSLYFQACPHTRCTHDQAPFQLLFGKPFLTEEVLNRQFRLSPDSFFQVNTLAAESLYETVLTLAAPNYMTTLLDVCCGTGTLGIIASPSVRGVVGIEAVYSAVRDARANASTNECENVEIIPGLIEKKLPRVIAELDHAPDIVAVVNPGRGGVAPQVIRALRKCKQIERVVYVSCHAEGLAMKNFVQLCAPCESPGQGKKWPSDGLPFSLRKVVPVDLFPHTVHCEMVLLFEREL